MEKGTKVKHYRILARLGEGGMGIVYRAEDTRLGRTVALKVLRENLAGDEDRIRRFEREARAASAVTHPGIATLYDFDRDDTTTFFTMEFVEGKTLKELLADGPLPLDRLLDCLSQVAEALGAAHRKGIIHRDLKPENVMAADSGFYKILDFGLARMDLGERVAAERDADATQLDTVTANLTQEGKILGTFAYMSPEQAQAHTVDFRSDIFSFGSLAYELATGKTPFQRKNPIATFHAIVHEDPEAISANRAEMPAELDRIVAKCLAKDVADRYQTAADLAVDLRALRSGSGSRSHYPPREAYRAPRRRPRWATVAGIAAAAVVLGSAAWILWRTAPALPSPGPATPMSVDVATAPRVGNRIVVVPFADRSGDPDDAWLSEGLPEMLTTDLARGGGLEVVSTQRLYDLLAAAGGGDLGDLDGQTINRLAQWAGAGVVVRGTIFKPADGYRIDLQAHDTTDGTVLAASRVQGTDVFDLADQLADELRRGLQVGSGPDEGIDAVTTSSPQAYRQFRAGMKLYEDLRFARAAERFREAQGIDPEFALAELRLGMSLFLAGDPEEGIGWMASAAARPERVPEREGSLALALRSIYVDGEPTAGEERLQEMAVRYAEDTESLFWLARYRAGPAGDPMDAIGTLREAMEIDPHDALAVAAMASLLDELNLPAEADNILQDYQERHPGADLARMRSLRLLAP